MTLSALFEGVRVFTRADPFPRKGEDIKTTNPSSFWFQLNRCLFKLAHEALINVDLFLACSKQFPLKKGGI